jgi:large subunit ribosomal protein L21
MFAIIKTGGKQYRVAPQDVITVARLPGNPGDVLELSEVLVVGGESVAVGNPTVPGAVVAAQLVNHGRGEKVIAFKKRRRKNSRRKRGHRQDYSVLRIADILTEGRTLDSAVGQAQPAIAENTSPAETAPAAAPDAAENAEGPGAAASAETTS